MQTLYPPFQAFNTIFFVAIGMGSASAQVGTLLCTVRQ